MDDSGSQSAGNTNLQSTSTSIEEILALATPEPAPTISSANTDVTSLEPKSEPGPEPAPVPSKSAKSPKKKSRRRGLIAALICAAVVLLAGVGTFAAFAIISSQPTRLISSAIGNLVSTKQVAMRGTVNISAEGMSAIGIRFIGLDINAAANNADQLATTAAKINFVDGSDMAIVELGEILLSDGKAYVRVDGLRALYNDVFYDRIDLLLNQMVTSSYRYRSTQKCLDSTASFYSKCYEQSTEVADDSELEAMIDSAVATIENEISNIIYSIDDEWFEISIDDIMGSDLFVSVNPIARRGITTTYNCLMDKRNNLPAYSDDIATAYQSAPFIKLTPAADSYYDVAFDAGELSRFADAFAKTKFYTEITSCGSSLGASGLNYYVDDYSSLEVDADSVKAFAEYYPTISVKFDGLFDHHLTGLRLAHDDISYTLAADFEFDYSDVAEIAAPAKSRPVMEIVENVKERIESLSDYIDNLGGSD